MLFFYGLKLRIFIRDTCVSGGNNINDINLYTKLI